jgi:hypothetical protein
MHAQPNAFICIEYRVQLPALTSPIRGFYQRFFSARPSFQAESRAISSTWIGGVLLMPELTRSIFSTRSETPHYLFKYNFCTSPVHMSQNPALGY